MLDHAKKYAQYSEDNFCSNKETKTLSVLIVRCECLRYYLLSYLEISMYREKKDHGHLTLVFLLFNK